MKSALLTAQLSKLHKTHKTYELGLNVSQATTAQTKAITAVLTVFEQVKGAPHPTITRKVTASGEAATLEDAQAKALEKVLTLAGVI